MTEDNHLFDYTPIVARPRLALPGGKRLAVWIGVAIEHYSWGRPAMSLTPHTADLVPDPLNYGWREYGPRVGIWRLFDVLDRFGVKGTALLNSEVVARHPQIVAAGQERGWAWVAHGANNSTWQVGMERDVEKEYIARVTEEIEAGTGHRPRGWLGPVLTASPNTYDILAELGYDYAVDWGIDDLPVPFNVQTGSLLSVPYATELNDIPLLNGHGQSGAEFRDALLDQFEVLHAEGADRPRVMGFGVHPFLSGQPFRAKYLAEALEQMTSHEDVWFATADEIATWYQEATG
jgi:allantoinase